MANVSDEKFIAVWTELGSPQAVADHFGLDVRGVYRRRNALEKRGFKLETKTRSGPNNGVIDKQQLQEQLQRRLNQVRHSVRRGIALEKGRVLVFSDAHFYPDDETTAFRALVECIK